MNDFIMLKDAISQERILIRKSQIFSVEETVMSNGLPVRRVNFIDTKRGSELVYESLNAIAELLN